MKYSDAEIKAHAYCGYCVKGSEIIEQLRAELAEAKFGILLAKERERNFETVAHRNKNEVIALRADIERKRARIAALPSTFPLVLGEKQRPHISKDDVLAILDDKETP